MPPVSGGIGGRCPPTGRYGFGGDDSEESNWRWNRLAFYAFAVSNTLYERVRFEFRIELKRAISQLEKEQEQKWLEESNPEEQLEQAEQNDPQQLALQRQQKGRPMLGAF